MRACGVLLSLIGCFQAPPATMISAADSLQRVRATNGRILAALHEGQRLAPTFSRLVNDLEQSDVIVYLQPGECACGAARSCVTFVTASGSTRCLRATVSLRQIQSELIAHIGHELFHATEIARAGEIVGARELREFYQRRGRRTCGCF